MVTSFTMKYYFYVFFSLWSTVYITNVETNSIQSRIISGTPATLGQFPWHVLIKEDEYDNLKCGGSIISENWILTAAHCLYKLTHALLVFGSVELGNDTHNMTANEFFIHPNYSPGYPNNDIALIKLPTPLNFTSSIQPIALVDSSQSSNKFVGSIAIIAGFGLTDDEYLDPSPVLLWAQVKIVQTSICQNTYPKEKINDMNLCAYGSANTNMSPCSGDSGGALILIMNGSPVQIGITSFVAEDMCTEGYPSGYVRLTSYLPYISSVTNLSLS